MVIHEIMGVTKGSYSGKGPICRGRWFVATHGHAVVCLGNLEGARYAAMLGLSRTGDRPSDAAMSSLTGHLPPS